MKRVLSVVVAALFVLGVGYKLWNDPEIVKLTQPSTTASSVKSNVSVSAVASGFFTALCAHDAKYLSAHSGGALAGTEDAIAAYFARSTRVCASFRYLGSLVSPAGNTQYVAVLVYADGETWYVMTTDADGLAISLE